MIEFRNMLRHEEDRMGAILKIIRPEVMRVRTGIMLMRMYIRWGERATTRRDQLRRR
jgi:hypothetical protein